MSMQDRELLAVMHKHSEGLHSVADCCRDADLKAAMRERAKEFDEAHSAVADVISERNRLANIVRDHERQILRMTEEASTQQLKLIMAAQDVCSARDPEWARANVSMETAVDTLADVLDSAQGGK